MLDEKSSNTVERIDERAARHDFDFLCRSVLGLFRNLIRKSVYNCLVKVLFIAISPCFELTADASQFFQVSNVRSRGLICLCKPKGTAHGMFGQPTVLCANAQTNIIGRVLLLPGKRLVE